MKIDEYGSASAELAEALSPSVAHTAKSTPTSSSVPQAFTEDTTSFASGSTSVEALTTAALDSSARAAKIASLQQAVQSGQYAVAPANIAAALSKADF